MFMRSIFSAGMRAPPLGCRTKNFWLSFSVSSSLLVAAVSFLCAASCATTWARNPLSSSRVALSRRFAPSRAASRSDVARSSR